MLFDVKVWLYGAVAASVGASRVLPSREDTELRIRLDGKTRRTNIPSSYSLRDKPPDFFYIKIHVFFIWETNKKEEKMPYLEKLKWEEQSLDPHQQMMGSILGRHPSSLQVMWKSVQ